MATLRTTLAALPLSLLLLSPTMALDVELSGTDAPVERIEANYTCQNGREFMVTYLNAGHVALAIFPPKEAEPLVFSRVISASGSRYVANTFEWWIKGRASTLTDLIEGPDAAGTSCETA